MQLLSKAIHGILTADTDITDTVGSGNIWHSKIPQRTTSGSDAPVPISIYFYTYALDPVGSTKTGASQLDEHKVRVVIVGKDDDDMSQVAQYVRYSLDRIEPGYYTGINIQGSEFLNASFDPEGSYELENQSWVLEFSFRVIDDLIRTYTTPTTMPEISSGTYTPTLSAQDNVSFLSISQSQYMRVGATVTVSGIFTAEVTNGLSSGGFEITLPVASNIGAVEDAAGVCSSNQSILYAGSITGSVANNTALFAFTGEQGGSLQYAYTFTYQII